MTVTIFLKLITKKAKCTNNFLPLIVQITVILLVPSNFYLKENIDTSVRTSNERILR